MMKSWMENGGMDGGMVMGECGKGKGEDVSV